MAVNISTVISELLPTLNASSVGNLIWWTQTELEGYGDEVVQKLTRENRLIAAVQSTLILTPNLAQYDLPAQHVATLQVIAGSLVLEEKTTAEMEALNPAWMTEANVNPLYWIGDAIPGKLLLSPIPTLSGSYSTVYLAHANEVTAAAPSADIPSVLSEYVFLSMAARALRKETRGSKPEAAAAIEQMMAPLGEIIDGIWGIS
jgi:hypothetical protein